MGIWMYALLNVAFLSGFSMIIYRFFRNRESKLVDGLRAMLEDAVDGNFNSDRLDETKLSALENSLKRFLADCEVSSDELRKQKEMIETMISDISHQCTTPIANIKLYAQLLAEVEDEHMDEVLAIEEQVEKLDFLIQSLVKLSRLETGIVSVFVKEEKVTKIWKALKSQFSIRAEQKNICLQIEETEISAQFDLKWTIEAVANIVDNAIKYTPEGGHVFISAEAYQFFTSIDVTDTGIGLEEEELSRVFTRFYRVPEVSDIVGIGIGLFLARLIVQVQKGYIKVRSVKGIGSTFSVFLPLPNKINQNCDIQETVWRH